MLITKSAPLKLTLSALLALAISFGIHLPAHAVGEEILIADSLLSGNFKSDDASEQEGEASNSADSNLEEVDAGTTGAGNLTQTEGMIETKAKQVDDVAIKQRIAGIFSEIDGLGGISVSVNEGVVSLTGEVPNEKKAKQAVNLANRVSEVVAVEDNISRTLDVQDNVTPVIAGLKQQAQGLIKAIPLLLVAILVFALVTWFGGWIARRNALWQRITPNPFVAELLAQSVKVLFVILGLILALSLMGAEAIIGTLLGGAGVIGIAVGFAVKDTIENYIASLMLSVRQPFRARDQVNINGQEGIVVRLTSRATILMTLDGNQLRIPNAEVFKGTILNYTKNPERRFTFELGVDANDDPLAAIKVGLDAINALDFVLTEPKSIAIITNVGDSNIVLEFQVWVNQSETDFAKARSIAIRETKHALENSGFSLPEPIYRLRFNGDVENALKHLSGGASAITVAEMDAPTTPRNTTDTAIIPPSSSASDSTSSIVKTDSTATSKQDAPSPHDISPDHKDKLDAKARAKNVLGDADATDILDAKPDPKLMEKVEQEIAESNDGDLLSTHSPQE